MKNRIKQMTKDTRKRKERKISNKERKKTKKKDYRRDKSEREQEEWKKRNKGKILYEHLFKFIGKKTF